MSGEIKIHIQRYIDECSLLLSLINDLESAKSGSAKDDVGKSIIALGAQALAEDIFGTRDAAKLGKRVTMKYLNEQERQRYEQNLRNHENRFNSLSIEIKSFLNTASIQRRGLTPDGNSHLLLKRLAAVQSLSRPESRIRKLSAILQAIQTEPLLYNKDIPAYLSELDNARNIELKKDAPDRQTAAYDLLKNLEKQMRLLIQRRLSKISDIWWVERIPQDVRENAELKKERNEKPSPWTEIINAIKGSNGRGVHLLQYVDFNDYIKIIRRGDNWREAFKEVFRDEVISAKLKEIDPIRNHIAHSREITKEQFKRLELHSNDIIRSVSQFVS